MGKFSTYLLGIILFGFCMQARLDTVRAQTVLQVNPPPVLPIDQNEQGGWDGFPPPAIFPIDTSKKVQSLDTVKFDMYGNLRVDDPIYNPKGPWYIPAINIVAQEVLLNVADQYIFNYIGPASVLIPGAKILPQNRRGGIHGFGIPHGLGMICFFILIRAQDISMPHDPRDIPTGRQFLSRSPGAIRGKFLAKMGRRSAIA